MWITLEIRCYFRRSSVNNRAKSSINNLSIMRKIAFNLAGLKLTRYMLDFRNIRKLLFEDLNVTLE